MTAQNCKIRGIRQLHGFHATPLSCRHDFECSLPMDVQEFSSLYSDSQATPTFFAVTYVLEGYFALYFEALKGKGNKLWNSIP